MISTHKKGPRPPAAVWTTLLAAAVLAALPPAGRAQENLGRGRITGTVVDESGAPIEGVKILVEKIQATTTLEGATDKKGRFAVAGLGSGMWRVKASKDGFTPAYTDMNVAQLKANPPINLTLKKLAGLQGVQADKAGLGILDRGNELLKNEDYDGALAAFEEFLAKYPDVYQVRLNVATVWLRKGDLDKAAAEFQAVLDKSRQETGAAAKDKATTLRALTGLGEIALKKGDLEAARKYFTDALAVSPEDESAAYNVGEMLFSNQKVDEAITYFELAAKIKPEWPKPYYRLGFVYLNKGDFAKAQENFNKFVELDPGNPEVPNVKNIIATIEKMKKRP